MGTKAWSQQSVPVGPGGGWEGVTVPGLCVRWRVSYSSCFALNALLGLGGLKTLWLSPTALLSPQLLLLSCAERSQQKCGWRRITERNIVQGQAVWAVRRSCALNGKSVRRNTPPISWGWASCPASALGCGIQRSSLHHNLEGEWP